MDKERIQRVRDRLFLYDKISDLKESFQGKEYIEYTSDGDYMHKYRHYEALRFYLLLTCFDILGQQADYVDFDQFLKATKFKKERENFINTLPSDLDLVSKVKRMYQYYLDTYGVTKRCLYFINSILNETERNRLYSSIQVNKITNPLQKESRSVQDISSHTKKNNFLLKIRNQFTHEGESWATGAPGVFGDVMIPI